MNYQNGGTLDVPEGQGIDGETENIHFKSGNPTEAWIFVTVYVDYHGVGRRSATKCVCVKVAKEGDPDTQPCVCSAPS